MRMRSITLAQGSERVRRCTNQDPEQFTTSAAFHVLVPVFASCFCSREARVHLLLSVYCTRSEGAMIATDHWRTRIGNVPVLPRPHLQHSQQDKPQGCPLSTFTTNSEHASLTSHSRSAPHVLLLSLPSRPARRVVDPLLHHKVQHFDPWQLRHGMLLLVINWWLSLVLLVSIWA